MSADLEPRLFGTVERRLFRATAVLLSIVALGVLIAGIIWTLGVALSFFYTLIMPLSVAGILALVLNPVVDHLERRARLSRVAATSIIVLLFVAIIVGVIVMVVPTLVRQVAQFTEMAPGILAGWQESLSRRFPGLTRMVVDSLQDGEIKELVPDMEGTGRTVRFYAAMLVGLSVVPLMLFFALLSGSRLRAQAIEVLSVFSAPTRKNVMHLMDVFLSQVTGFFRGQLVIAMIMGVMYSVGFTSIGLKGGILIGLVLGLLNIVPFLGTLIGLLIVLPLAYFQPEGGFQLLGLSVLVFTVVQLAESWLLTPKIMADRSGLHPALVVIAVFFWGTALGGITGMILAVPLTAFLVAVWGQAKASLAESMTSDHDASRIEILSGNEEPSRMGDPPGPRVRGRGTAVRASSQD
jgi:predicted PurR-regulated permease PerM